MFYRTTTNYKTTNKKLLSNYLVNNLKQEILITNFKSSLNKVGMQINIWRSSLLSFVRMLKCRRKLSDSWWLKIIMIFVFESRDSTSLFTFKSTNNLQITVLRVNQKSSAVEVRKFFGKKRNFETREIFAKKFKKKLGNLSSEKSSEIIKKCT